ncbi:hypothetical protein BH09PAT2_BH09PAT2_01110 [soil metagenome]
MEETEKKDGMNPMIIVAIVAVVAIAGIAFMMSRNNSNTQTDTMMKQAAPAEDTAMTGGEKMAATSAPADDTAMKDDSMMKADASEVQIVNIEGGSFYFKPNEIHVKKGQKVKVVMNAVSMMHDFVIDELDVRMPVVKNGSKGEVEFTADKAGTYEFYCSVGQHRANGQVGKLIVE